MGLTWMAWTWPTAAFFLCAPPIMTSLFFSLRQIMGLMSVTPGISVITEKIYPDRFMHVSELNRMGAHIQREGPHAIVEGVEGLSGAPVMASDLRASACLVLAGLAAKGKTSISRIYHLERGYENIEKKLEKLGAKVWREKE